MIMVMMMRMMMMRMIMMMMMSSLAETQEGTRGEPEREQLSEAAHRSKPAKPPADHHPGNTKYKYSDVKIQMQFCTNTYSDRATNMNKIQMHRSKPAKPPADHHPGKYKYKYNEKYKYKYRNSYKYESNTRPPVQTSETTS